jgi:septal ring factor EnvC (AmiA/AmiB activator)
MALITIAEAGRLTGKGRPAIYTAINAAPPNNLSVVIDNGKKMLDPAEVQRVFGPFKNSPSQGAAPAAESSSALIDALQAQIEQLKAAAAKAEAREAAANERAAAAEARAAKAEAKADDYLIRLLPAPVQEPEKKGFFARLFGS